MRDKRTRMKSLLMTVCMLAVAMLACCFSDAGEWRYVDTSGAVLATLQDVDTAAAKPAPASKVDIDPIDQPATQAAARTAGQVMQAPAVAVTRGYATTTTKTKTVQPRRLKARAAAVVPMMTQAVAPAATYRVAYSAAVTVPTCPNCGRAL